MSMIPTQADLLVVGAGPAGMAAADEASRRGLRVVLADENAELGGQIYRGVSTPAKIDAQILGPDYFAGRRLVETVSGTTAVILRKTGVWMIEREAGGEGFSVGLSQNDTAHILSAKAVLIATGALERPFPFSGWTLPGVMTAGAAQILLKVSGAVPEGPVVIAGTGPLIYLLAAQFTRAGVEIAALLDTTPRINWLKALKHFPAFLLSPYFRKGLRLFAEVQKTKKIVHFVSDLSAHGSERLDEVSFIAGGARNRLKAQTLLIHQGVVPQINLGLAAGCEHRWNAARLAFEPALGPMGESTVDGVFVAGDGAGIGGATVAELRGRLSAIGIASRINGATSHEDVKAIDKLRGRLAFELRGRGFLDELYRPAKNFRIPTDDVIVCRCEEVTAGQVRAAAAQGAQGPNQVKSFLRSGMGPCQGRLCGLTVSELMADQLKQPVGAIGHYRIRNPVKPITVGALAGASPQHGEAVTARPLF